MSKLEKYIISVEVFKYPYCGKSSESLNQRNFYQKKFVVVLLKFGKKSLEKRSEYSFMDK